MSNSISSSLSNVPVAGANVSSNAPTIGNQPPAANPAQDTVKLSETQQVYQLYNQGQRVSQIATTLNLPVSVVNHYLNISNSG